MCVCELTGACEVTAPTISHHLKVLRESGLIASQRRGTWVYYWVLPGVLERLASLFTPQPVPAEPVAAAPVTEPVSEPGAGPVAVAAR